MRLLILRRKRVARTVVRLDGETEGERRALTELEARGRPIQGSIEDMDRLLAMGRRLAGECRVVRRRHW